ncbi:MAG: hypothetical protein OXC66_07100 [Roseovarius sp.]|nr:hypothetical protein [Roseovarius sp.]
MQRGSRLRRRLRRGLEGCGLRRCKTQSFYNAFRELAKIEVAELVGRLCDELADSGSKSPRKNVFGNPSNPLQNNEKKF